LKAFLKEKGSKQGKLTLRGMERCRERRETMILPNFCFDFISASISRKIKYDYLLHQTKKNLIYGFINKIMNLIFDVDDDY